METQNSFTISLPLLAIVLGVALAGTHLVGIAASGFLIKEAKAFPRSRFWGTLLLGIAILWALGLTATTDLGEFSPIRNFLMLGVLGGGILLWKFVPDFLSSRSLGFLLLLAAHPVLETTFLHHGVAKIALALLAYGWALAGLFLVGMPYLHRDLIGWICARKWRWDLVCWAGVAYGILLLISGLLG
ncbi:MAG: hypothetical protein K8R57_04815 [Verrucomicrobia bacterium]|nr:hypothetical protein [Verrucomicrobiota bacterium]